MTSLRSSYSPFIRSLVCGLLLCGSLAAETTTDTALWTGGIVFFEKEKDLNYSAEYQVRLNDDMSSLSSHFLELMKYHSVADRLLLNGGYRFTIRPDHVENRLYLGGFLEITPTPKPPEENPNRFKAILQVGYQHDFNVEFDEQLMDSDSIRGIVHLSKPINKTIAPFVMAGALTTWNDAYSLGLDKTRLGGGVVIKMTKGSQLRCQYLWEESYFMTPEKHSNIIWLRYELIFGN